MSISREYASMPSIQLLCLLFREYPYQDVIMYNDDNSIQVRCLDGILIAKFNVGLQPIENTDRTWKLFLLFIVDLISHKRRSDFVSNYCHRLLSDADINLNIVANDAFEQQYWEEIVDDIHRSHKCASSKQERTVSYPKRCWQCGKKPAVKGPSFQVCNGCSTARYC